jgi:hypothetical protein
MTQKHHQYHETEAPELSLNFETANIASSTPSQVTVR